MHILISYRHWYEHGSLADIIGGSNTDAISYVVALLKSPEVVA
jgi:hypothetical protein